MEMEYHDTRRHGWPFIIAGVILALVAGGAAFYILNEAPRSSGPTDIERTPAVVAIRAIVARTPIQAADVAIREVPVDPSTEQSLIKSIDDVVGHVSVVPIPVGQLVTSNTLTRAGASGTIALLGPTETVGPDSEPARAVSLTVPADRAVGDLLEVGQTVDVIATATVKVPDALAAAGGFYTDRSTKVVYQNMVILARNGDQYVVRAPLAVAEEISHMVASDSALFSLVLRPDIDVRIIDVSALGATTNRIIAKYGLPIPEVYPGSGFVSPTLLPLPQPSTSPSFGGTPSDGAPSGGASDT